MPEFKKHRPPSPYPPRLELESTILLSFARTAPISGRSSRFGRPQARTSLCRRILAGSLSSPSASSGSFSCGSLSRTSPIARPEPPWRFSIICARHPCCAGQIATNVSFEAHRPMLSTLRFRVVTRQPRRVHEIYAFHYIVLFCADYQDQTNNVDDHEFCGKSRYIVSNQPKKKPSPRRMRRSRAPYHRKVECSHGHGHYLLIFFFNTILTNLNAPVFVVFTNFRGSSTTAVRQRLWLFVKAAGTIEDRTNGRLLRFDDNSGSLPPTLQHVTRRCLSRKSSFSRRTLQGASRTWSPPDHEKATKIE